MATSVADIGKFAKAAVAANIFSKAVGAASSALNSIDKANAKAAKSADKFSDAHKKATEASKKLAEAVKKGASAEEIASLKTKSAIANKTEVQAQSTAATDAATASEATEATVLGAVAAAAVAAAVAVAALVYATASLAAKAIEVVQQRAALLATFAAIGGGAAAGKATLAMVDKLAERLPFVREQIDAWAESLQSAGFRGKALESAIKAVAAAEAIRAGGGKAAEKMLKTLAEGGQGATKMAQQIAKGGAKSNKILADMGLSSRDVTKALKEMGVKGSASADQVGQAIEKALASRGKDPLTEMGQTWPIIAAKAKEGFLSLFENLGPAVKPFMAAVQRLFAQFTRGTPTMKALGKIVTEVFGALFKYGTMAVNVISKFVAQNVTAKKIGSTWQDIKAGVSKVASALVTLWGFFKPILTSAIVLKGISTIFKVLGVVIVVVAAAMASMFAIMTALAGAFATVASAIWGVVGGIANIGAAIVQGVANFDPGVFVDKMRSMAAQGLAAFKSVLGIRSPSRVMMAMGGHIAAGAQAGVDRGAPGAVSSAGKLGAGMARGAATGASASGGKGSKGGITINGGVHIEVPHGTPSTWAEEAFAAFMERLAASQGA